MQTHAGYVRSSTRYQQPCDRDRFCNRVTLTFDFLTYIHADIDTLLNIMQQLNVHTHINKSFLYSAYKFNRVTMRFSEPIYMYA